MEGGMIGMDELHHNESHDGVLDESGSPSQQQAQAAGNGSHASVGSPSASNAGGVPQHAHSHAHAHQDQLAMQQLAAFQQQQQLLAHQFHQHHLHAHQHYHHQQPHQHIQQQYIDPATHQLQAGAWMHPHPGTAHPHQLHHHHHQQAVQPLPQAHPHGVSQHPQHAALQFNQQQQQAMGSGSDGGASGSDEDEDEGGKRGGGKRKRQMKSPEQLSLLEKEFAISPLPNKETRYRISALIGLTPRQVQIWFQNKRAKVKNAQRKRNPAFSFQGAPGAAGQPGVPVQPGAVPISADSKGSPKRRKAESEDNPTGQYPAGQMPPTGYPLLPHQHMMPQHPHQHIHPHMHPQLHGHLPHLQPSGHQHSHVHIQPQLAPQYYMSQAHAFPHHNQSVQQQGVARLAPDHQVQQIENSHLPLQSKEEHEASGLNLNLAENSTDAEAGRGETQRAALLTSEDATHAEEENGAAHQAEPKAKEVHRDVAFTDEIRYRVKSICKKAKKVANKEDDDEDETDEFADIGEELVREIEQLRERVQPLIESADKSEAGGAECLDLLTAFVESLNREWPSDVDSDEAKQVHQNAHDALSRLWEESFARLQSTMPAKLTARWTQAADSLNITINS